MADDKQRFTKTFPCPVCGGYDDRHLGQARCYGYQMGAYANCTVTSNGRERRDNGTWGHFLESPCRCGVDHSTGRAAPPPPHHEKATGTKKRVWLSDVMAGRVGDPGEKPMKGYRYTDADGMPVMAVTRTAAKKFTQWTYDAASGDFYAGLEVETVLYHLHDLAHAAQDEAIYITEGEKDADTLTAWGLLATSAPMGARSPWKPHYTQAVAGHPVVVCADNDDDGVKHAEKVKKALDGACPSVEVVYIPKAIGKDVSDYAAAGHTKDEFLRMIDSAWDDSVCMADVGESEIEWLWRGFLIRGELNDVVGEGGIGKSTIFAGDIAARITRGWPMPDGSKGVQGTVLLASAEESPDKVLKPRLMAAGADPAFVRSIGLRVEKTDTRKKRLLDLERDIADMERMVKKHNVQLIFIDPITSYLGPKADALKAQDVRRVLTPLADLAHRTGVTIVFIRHHTKGGNANAVHAGAGATAFTDVARMALHVVKDPDNEGARYLAPSKGNYLPEDEKHSMTYTLVPSEYRASTGRVQWTGTSREMAQDLNDRARAERGAGAAYIKVLREHGGPMHYKDIAAAIGNDDDKGINATKMALSRLVESGRVKAIGGGSGLYELPAGAGRAEGGDRIINLPDLMANFSGKTHQEHPAPRPQPMAANAAPRQDDRPHVAPDAAAASAPPQTPYTAPQRPSPATAYGMHAPRRKGDYEARIEAKQAEGMGYMEAVRAVDEETRQATAQRVAQAANRPAGEVA